MNDKIYFRGGEDASDETKLIKLFLHDSGLFKETFQDENLTIWECNSARRSFEDLLTVCRTYFGNTTEEELMQALINNNIRYYYCNDINKTVFHLRGEVYIKDGFNTYYMDSSSISSNKSPYTNTVLQEIWERTTTNKLINEHIEEQTIDSLGG